MVNQKELPEGLVAKLTWGSENGQFNPVGGWALAYNGLHNSSGINVLCNKEYSCELAFACGNYEPGSLWAATLIWELGHEPISFTGEVAYNAKDELEFVGFNEGLNKALKDVYGAYLSKCAG